MKYIKVAEIKNGKENVIFENTFNKLILCTDQYQGCLGMEGPMDLMKTLEEMVQSWCINSLDIDEDSGIDELIEAWCSRHPSEPTSRCSDSDPWAT